MDVRYRPCARIPAKIINIKNQPACRICLSNDRKMFHIKLCAKYFYSFAAIKVEEADGLPQWVCWQCRALLVKATHFKYKMIITNNILWQSYKRNALAAVDVNDVELNRYPLPELKPLSVTLCDTTMTAGNFIVLKHENTEITEPNLIEPKIEKIEEESNTFIIEDPFSKELENIETAKHNLIQPKPKDPLAVESHTLVMKDSFLKHLLETDNRKFTVKGVNSENEARGFEKMAVFSHSEKQDETTDTEDEFLGIDRKYEKRDETTDTEDEFLGIDRKYEKRDETTDTEDEFLSVDRKYEKRDETTDTEDEFLNIDRTYEKRDETTDTEEEILSIDRTYEKRDKRTDTEDEILGIDRTYEKRDETIDIEDEILSINRKYEKRDKRTDTEDEFLGIDRTYVKRDKTTDTEDEILGIDRKYIKTITLTDEEQKTFLEEKKAKALKYSFHCDLCFLGFDYEVKLQNHMKRHSPSRGEHKCEICHMYYKTPSLYCNHKLIHTTKYECLSCGHTLSNIEALREHCRVTHEGKLLKCDMCDKLFKRLATLYAHRKRSHKTLEMVKCDLCPKTFAQQYISKHRLSHMDNPRNYKCSSCGKTFPRRSSLLLHERTHRSEATYYCAECDVRFKTKECLQVHLEKTLKHRDPSTWFSCTRCEKLFDTKMNLKRHESIQHDGVREFVCDICDTALSHRRTLITHMLRVHGGVKLPRKYLCSECGKAFTTKRMLAQHVLIHTGEKPFSCEHCGRAFRQSSAMKTHIRLVHLKIKNNKKVVRKSAKDSKHKKQKFVKKTKTTCT